ncbi:MAG TPA: hypothetical protein VF595_17690 [Tepidisphaeraceae bacterium]|jgi:hypothetical protein
MMAKMFYTLDETKAALGKDDDAIKRLTSDGRLREFRDGPRLMYKADQVDTLRRDLESGADEIPLGPSDTGAPIGLVDSRTGSGPAISLSDSGVSSAQSMKEDTALAADLGLSGSIGLSQSIGLASTNPGGSVAGGSMAGGSLAGSMGGIPSPMRPAGGGSGLSGLSGSGSKGGINILEDEGADPAAQTAITPSNDFGAEGMGSGSGLLDLTRESDNTSLGAVLDEIPGGSMSGASFAGGSLAGTFAGGSLAGGNLVGTRGAETIGATVSSSGPLPAMAGSSRVITPPSYVEARDPLAPAFGWMAGLTTLFALIALLALSGGVLNVRSGLIQSIAEYSFLIIAGIGLGLAIIGFVIGMIMGRVRA